MKLPLMYRIRQRFDDTKVENIEETVKAELGKLSLAEIKPGHRVAITGGSRGIAYIGDILKPPSSIRFPGSSPMPPVR
jgi:hypothetical protein